MDRKLPEWKECCDHFDAGTATALETFIYHNEPADIGPGFQSEYEFREGLLAVLNELAASLEARSAVSASPVTTGE